MNRTSCMHHFDPSLIFLMVLVLAGCTSESQRAVYDDDARALIGTWTADDTTRFVFNEDGSAVWIIGTGDREDAFEIEYDYAAEVEPAHLDLSGFDRGFLRGRTLYCIVAFDSVSVFRMDCEPGEGVEVDVRPDTFSRKAITYRSDSTE